MAAGAQKRAGAHRYRVGGARRVCERSGERRLSNRATEAPGSPPAYEQRMQSVVPEARLVTERMGANYLEMPLA